MLVAPVGRDALGGMLEGMLEGEGMRREGLWRVEGEEGEGRTACCSLVLGKEGDLEGGVADMGIVEGLKGEEVSVGSTRFFSFSFPFFLSLARSLC